MTELSLILLAPQVWLKQPLVSVDDIRTRHDVVEAFVSDPELRERLRDQHLRGALSPLALLSIKGAVVSFYTSGLVHAAATCRQCNLHKHVR